MRPPPTARKLPVRESFKRTYVNYHSCTWIGQVWVSRSIDQGQGQIKKMSHLPNPYYYISLFLRSLPKDSGYLKVKALNIKVIWESNEKEILSIGNIFLICVLRGWYISNWKTSLLPTQREGNVFRSMCYSTHRTEVGQTPTTGRPLYRQTPCL